MTRFFKVFLRDQLKGRMPVAGFGKHPAWDDHIDDIGPQVPGTISRPASNPLSSIIALSGRAKDKLWSERFWLLAMVKAAHDFR
jgi:hypothetical protein